MVVLVCCRGGKTGSQAFRRGKDERVVEGDAEVND